MKIKKSIKVFKITYLQTPCWSWVHLLYVRKPGLAITRDLSYSDLPLTVSWELWTPIKPVQIENVDLDDKSPYEATIIRFRHLCCSSTLKCTHFSANIYVTTKTYAFYINRFLLWLKPMANLSFFHKNPPNLPSSAPSHWLWKEWVCQDV